MPEQYYIDHSDVINGYDPNDENGDLDSDKCIIFFCKGEILKNIVRVII